VANQRLKHFPTFALVQSVAVHKCLDNTLYLAPACPRPARRRARPPGRVLMRAARSIVTTDLPTSGSPSKAARRALNLLAGSLPVLGAKRTAGPSALPVPHPRGPDSFHGAHRTPATHLLSEFRGCTVPRNTNILLNAAERRAVVAGAGGYRPSCPIIPSIVSRSTPTAVRPRRLSSSVHR
jgi:hypothetical protein